MNMTNETTNETERPPLNPGYQPRHAIIVSEARNGNWVAAAYHRNGVVLESAVEETKEEALLQLSGRLLERLWAISSVMDRSKGSVLFQKIDASYVIEDKE